MAYHRVLLVKCLRGSVGDTWDGDSASHFAQPPTKCHVPTPTKATKPPKDTRGCEANPWLMYDRLIMELSPCM